MRDTTFVPEGHIT